MAPTVPPDPMSVAGRMRDELQSATAAGELNVEAIRLLEDGKPHPLVLLERAHGRPLAIEVVPRSIPPFVPPRRRSTDAVIVARSTAQAAFVFDASTGTRDDIVATLDLRDGFAAQVRSLGTWVLATRRERGFPGRNSSDHSDNTTAPGLSILRAYHATAVPRYVHLFSAAGSGGTVFREALARWSGRLGVETPDDVDACDLAAQFYPVLLAAEALLTTHGDAHPRPLTGKTAEGIVARLSSKAAEDFEHGGVSPPITSASAPFDRAPEDRGTERLLRNLVVALENVAPISDPGETIGRFYEEAIPAETRKPGGEYFTDGRIADLIARWVVPDRPSIDSREGTDPTRILDPAAGSGRFLDAGASRLADLDRDGRLIGVDVNPVVLHLAAVAHLLHPCGASLETRYTSFFSIEPRGDAATDNARRDAPSTDTLGTVDAIVGNPPFVRAGDLPMTRSHYRDHLSSMAGSEGDPVAISRRADLSVYFLTHGTRFLRDGGRLGFVVPSKWLAAAYAEDLRAFLFSRYKVQAVVGFGTRAFDDALVDAVLLLCERCTDPVARAETAVRFLRVDEPVAPDDLVAAVDETNPHPLESDGPTDFQSLAGRIVSRRQEDLHSEGPVKLTPYLNAPDPLLTAIDDPGLCPLSDLAAVSRGVMSGANDVFFVDPTTVPASDIADRFLHPAQKSIRGCDRPVLESDDPDQRILDVHEYVRTVIGPADVEHGADRVTRALRRDGYHGLADYLADAEANGRHQGRTCQRRPVWFDLGPLPTPDIFLPKLLRERMFPVRNRAEAVPSNAIDCLSVRDGIDADLLHGVLLSSVVEATMEVWGRDEAGMLQLMTYETETLPVPDVRQMDADNRAAIRRAAGRLTADPTDDAARTALDNAVADALGREEALAPDRIRNLRDTVRSRRLQRGDDVQVLVGDGP